MRRIAMATLLSVTMASGAMAQQVTGVYLKEAKQMPFERQLFIDAARHEVTCTAFYSGAQKPAGDIRVSLEADPAKVAPYNAANGTRYAMLPKGSYTIENPAGVIPAGNVCAEPVKVVVRTKGFKPFTSYLLPLTLKTEGSVGVDPALSTVYYVIEAVPAPGQVARKKVAQLAPDTREMFAFGPKSLMVRAADGSVALYAYNPSGSLGKAVAVAGSENLKKMDVIGNFNGHHIVGIDRTVADGQTWGFPLSADGRTIGAMDKVFGTSGYNIFSMLIPTAGGLYFLKPSGEMMLYNLSPSLEWGNIRTMGGGWNYPVIFAYGNSLIGVDQAGDMWRYPLLENGLASIPERIGSGWNAFVKITAVGSDLLALDKEGNLWQFKFNDKGFWAL